MKIKMVNFEDLIKEKTLHVDFLARVCYLGDQTKKKTNDSAFIMLRI